MSETNDKFYEFQNFKWRIAVKNNRQY